MSTLSQPPAAIQPALTGTQSSRSTQGLNFKQTATLVMTNLQHAAAALLAALPGEKRRAAEVERAFGVDPKLGWQLFRIATAGNPLAEGINVPARTSVEKLLRAAGRRRVPRETIQSLESAFNDFEEFVKVGAGDRASFEAMVTAMLPEAREKYELTSKQTAFTAMSQIRGVAMEQEIGTRFRYPSADGVGVESANLIAKLGLRRVRPGAHVVLGGMSHSKAASTSSALDGSTTNGQTDLVIPEFCSSPIPRFKVEKRQDFVCYELADQDIGMQSAMDVAMGFRWDGQLRRYFRNDGSRYTFESNALDIPTKRLVLDIFIHRDLYPGSEPVLSIQDSAVLGAMSRFDDPAREHTRLDMQEAIRSLGVGFDHARLIHVPRYVEMLQYACGKLGWEPDVFRGYRLEVAYPLYGAEYMVGFELPEAPK